MNILERAKRIFERNRPADGKLRDDVTSRLRGQVIDSLWSNGRVLSIRMHGGAMAHIAWIGPDGEPVDGRPILVRHGVLLRAEGMRDIIGAREAGVRSK